MALNGAAQGLPRLPESFKCARKPRQGFPKASKGLHRLWRDVPALLSGCSQDLKPIGLLAKVDFTMKSNPRIGSNAIALWAVAVAYIHGKF